MAQDPTHAPGSNYQSQDGTWFVNKTLTIGSTATINFENGSVLDMSTGGYIKHYVEQGTTATNLRAYGLSTLYNSSAGGAQIYTLDPPIKGVPKYLAVLRTDSSDTVRVEFGAGVTLLATTGATNNALVWATSGSGGLPPGGVTLMGASTSAWAIVGSIGTIATTS